MTRQLIEAHRSRSSSLLIGAERFYDACVLNTLAAPRSGSPQGETLRRQDEGSRASNAGRFRSRKRDGCDERTSVSREDIGNRAAARRREKAAARTPVERNGSAVAAVGGACNLVRPSRCARCGATAAEVLQRRGTRERGSSLATAAPPRRVHGPPPQTTITPP